MTILRVLGQRVNAIMTLVMMKIFLRMTLMGIRPREIYKLLFHRKTPLKCLQRMEIKIGPLNSMNKMNF
jgi:hypothetical protein